ncbi:hypothetical protein DASB73_042000 [Starmerella bacillaris]|uniref:Uncharacterized protein n=1 Tax=Starmerella bacillaris TaxID=1247836 RepID=A0AAV5RPR6_STABA|nr:hypothetical protein DASB73_042000 [Starmerella bacillaris]
MLALNGEVIFSKDEFFEQQKRILWNEINELLAKYKLNIADLKSKQQSAVALASAHEEAAQLWRTISEMPLE